MRVARNLAVAAAGLLLACSPPGHETLSGEIVVELDAFSGRPDPSWTLTRAEARELARRLRDLPPAQGSSAVPERLGYRGFWIYAGRPPTRVFVHDGLVAIIAPGGAGTLRRDARGAEAWLVAEATRHGYGGVFGR
jgi:hypothetical protein